MYEFTYITSFHVLALNITYLLPMLNYNCLSAGHSSMGNVCNFDHLLHTHRYRFDCNYPHMDVVQLLIATGPQSKSNTKGTNNSTLKPQYCKIFAFCFFANKWFELLFVKSCKSLCLQDRFVDTLWFEGYFCREFSF